MIVMFVLSDASAALIIIMTHAFNILFYRCFPPPNWRGYYLCLICFMTDPEQRANCRSLPCEPLLSDDGRGIEDLDEGQLKERELGHPLTMSRS